jgi:protein phosphatase
MRCPRCDAENRPDARFCRTCGQPLAEPPATVPPSAEPAESLPDAGDTDLALPALAFPDEFEEASPTAVAETEAEHEAEWAQSAVDDSDSALPAAGALIGELGSPLTSVEEPEGASALPEGRVASEPPPVALAADTAPDALATPLTEAEADSTEGVSTLLGADNNETTGAASPALPAPPAAPAAETAAPDDNTLGEMAPAAEMAAPDDNALDEMASETGAPPAPDTGEMVSETGQPPQRPIVAAAAPEFDTVDHDDNTPPGGLTAVPADATAPVPATTGADDTPTAEFDMAALTPGESAGLGTPGETPTASLDTMPLAEADRVDAQSEALPPFGEPETVPDPVGDTGAGGAIIPPGDITAAMPPTPPAETGLSGEAATSKLAEEDVTTAPPVPGEPFPALQPGDTVAGRYEIQQVLQTGPERQTYRAADLQGYLRCWACGSRDNIQGEMYCTNCGAQLTGRTYRLFETPPNASPPALPAPLLENMHSGVAGVFDGLTDPATGRHYLVLEDVGGQSLASRLTPAAGDAPQEAPSEGQLASWINAATQTLAELHAARVLACDFSPAAWQILPDDRLVLVDPSACRMTGEVGDTRDPAAEEQADVQRVAAALEQWLPPLATPPAATPPPEASSAAKPQAAARPAQADEATIRTVLAQGREGAYKTAAAFAAAVHEVVAADSAPADLQLISGRATDVGVQRKLNEDSLFALETVTFETSRSTPTALYIVADGMGGHESGEVASSIAVRTIPAMLNSILDGRINGDNAPPDGATLDKAVRESILEANRRIAELGRQRRSDMGTTVTMALVMGNQVTVANVGDSRTYLWCDGKLHKISEDHSLVARLIAAGQLTDEEGRHFERRNEIYRALGDAHLLPDDVDVFHVRLRPLDALLLCSDGLWEMVRDADMERIMLEAADPPAAVQALIAEANRAGGEDNITVIIAQTLTSSEDDHA